ncbi:MAG: HEPN domain-containing protein [Magnetococcales bacterium]|nr:HEPN domain-containing protein [Magnetococcales bacterium]
MGGMLDAKTFTDAIFGFHTQQAVEKLLKAWMSALGLRYPSTHIIGHLLALLEPVADVTAFWQWGDFTPYAVQYRYASNDQSGEEAPLDRHHLIQRVSQLLEQVEKIISSLR